ncbi:DUF551 domain-containing protein [Klebsiella pneumoniae]|nr:DUF551 domain-containing protein [Klebsiella pneumoniae]MBZ1582654.1 DUF551 domain-containing protein [Klebsiella pneumoniae]
MTNNQLAENSVNQLLNSVKLARFNAELADNRIDHSFYYALTIALEELQERRKADSEPVAIIDQANLDYLRSGADADVWPPEREEIGDVLLYRHAQPALVVPDEIKHRIGGLDWGWEGEFNRGWNAYRAAMLAAAQHDTPALNSLQSVDSVAGKWIPVSERLPEDSGRYWCYVEEQNDLGKSHYQWNCSWNGDRWWVESEGGGIVTHWMPLPAAPQEVK